MTSPTSGDSAAGRYPRSVRVDASGERGFYVNVVGPDSISLAVVTKDSSLVTYLSAHEAAAVAHALREAVLVEDATDVLTPEDPQLPF